MEKNEGEVEAQAEVEAVEAEVVENNEAENQDTTDWKAKHDELAGRLKRAETKLEKSKIEKTVEKKVEERIKTGELDETQLDYLDLKGVSNEDEIEVIHKIMQKTGQTVRQALKDDYVVAKLDKLRKEREVKDATPSATRRSGNATNDVDYWVAKYQQSKELPDDFKLRSAVINKMVEKENTNKPAWQK